MRSTLYLVLILLVAGTAAYLAALARDGRRMRAQEAVAARDVESIMRLQETRRERQAARGDPVRFATFGELQEEGHLEEFQVLDRGLTYEIARHADYVFRLSLLSGEASGGAPLPAQRYELWAWPANPAERSLVLYYGNNSGYLIQGENGETAGLSDRPLDVQPLRELEAEKDFTVNRRWTILADVRKPPAAAAGAPADATPR